MPAPIALFVYNRPWHTRQTVSFLQKNHLCAESDLVIFSDGPKSPQNVEAVNEVRSLLRTINGFKSVRIVESPFNKGLAKSIIEGVTEVLKTSDTIIVLEDDLVTSPYFLQYMNDGLNVYWDEEKVVSIHGYMYPVKTELPETFFIRGTDCWGWATWRRGWQLFDPDGSKLLKGLKDQGLTREFNFDGSYPYVRMLENQINGRNNSWAIRWYAAAFLANRLTLYPGASLVNNIGYDGSGTHTRKWNQEEYLAEVSQRRTLVEKIPRLENETARKIMARFHRRQQSIVNAAIRKLKLFLSR
jgi:hypothetical protein